ncbi:extracellular solute-binding protein [Kamptonema formosum]|uniref:extracellular solute-binding protein n=1 Tax=Kamptonema formosum TaxID=331992 RepID=UPI000476354D|nr:extracellular solute-binding protein [Oscillatoria sp. PCC 10802]
MYRRSFLVGAGTVALGQLLAGCGGQNQPALSVRLLKGSVPSLVLSKFRKQLGQPAALDFKAEPQLKDLFAQLQAMHRQPKAGALPKSSWPFQIPWTAAASTGIPDLVTLGDYWLAKAIEQKLIQPLTPAQLPGWERLPSRWQMLVRRNDSGQIDKNGQVWAAPYRWGTVMIAYRRDKFKSAGLQPPQDWDDLWRPELARLISLPDQPREVIGLTLKKLGKSYNTTELDKVPELKKELLSLHRQVKLYSSDAYLQPLILGDTWLAVGWSSDLLPVLPQEPTIAVAVPQSGTSLWADLWVAPNRAGESSTGALPHKWIEFCWEEKIAALLSLQSFAASPVFAGTTAAELPKQLQKNELLVPDAKILDKSEFLHNLPDAAVEQYRSLWREIRLS